MVSPSQLARVPWKLTSMAHLGMPCRQGEKTCSYQQVASIDALTRRPNERPNEYQKKYEAQQVKYMKKKAAKLGFQLIPA
jgi:hypothetical protein